MSLLQPTQDMRVVFFFGWCFILLKTNDLTLALTFKWYRSDIDKHLQVNSLKIPARASKLRYYPVDSKKL